MVTRRLTPTDAQTFWLASKIPNDTFLLFGFDGVATDLPQALDDVLARARSCPDLSLRVADDATLRYPRWVGRDADRSQLVAHDLEDPTWAGCLAAVCGLIADQVDARVLAWRLHVFSGVTGIPGTDGVGTVAVVQISHALGGGGRTSAHAAVLFGRTGVVIPEIHPPSGSLPVAGFRAARAHRRLLADEAAGTVPAQAKLRPLQRTNAAAVGTAESADRRARAGGAGRPDGDRRRAVRRVDRAGRAPAGTR